MRPETATSLLENVRKTYNSIAPEFDRTRRTLWSDFDHFVPYIPDSPKILDVGCGNGRLLQYFDNRSFRSYVGIDPSSKLLTLARNRHKGAKIRFNEGDVLNLPVHSAAYNAVFSLAVLHHIPSLEFQRRALAEMGRALSPDGLLFLSVWDLNRLKNISYFARAFVHWIFSRGDTSPRDLHIPWGRKNPEWRYAHAFTQRELSRLLWEAGFEILSSRQTSKGQSGNLMVVARPFLASRKAQVMGVDFHAVTLEQAVRSIGGFLKSEKQHLVVTPNPEIVLYAQRNEAYRRLLNRASLSVPDGIGILWASRYVHETDSRLRRFFLGLWGLGMVFLSPKRLTRTLPERVTGTDLMQELIHKSHLLGAKVFLLGAAPGVAARVAEKWRFDRIVGTYSGSPSPDEDRKITQMISNSEANLLFVAFGSPKQEEWIARNLKKMPYVKVAIGVGGAFDFHAGLKSRAPHAMRRFGVEWLWRVLREPRRIRRILNATLVFPFRAILNRKDHD